MFKLQSEWLDIAVRCYNNSNIINNNTTTTTTTNNNNKHICIAP